MSLLDDLHELRAEFAVSGDEFAAVRLATVLAKRREQPMTSDLPISEWPVVAEFSCRACGGPARHNPSNAFEWGCDRCGSSFSLALNFTNDYIAKIAMPTDLPTPEEVSLCAIESEWGKRHVNWDDECLVAAVAAAIRALDEQVAARHDEKTAAWLEDQAKDYRDEYAVLVQRLAAQVRAGIGGDVRSAEDRVAASDAHWRQVAEEVIAEMHAKVNAGEIGLTLWGADYIVAIIRRRFAKEKA